MSGVAIITEDLWAADAGEVARDGEGGRVEACARSARRRVELDPGSLAQAFARLAPERAALRASDLPGLNFHPGHAAAFVLDVIVGLTPLHAEIHAHTSFGPAELERLEDAARAVLWAQHRLVAERAATATDPKDDGARIILEAMALRTRLAHQAKELRAWEVLPADAVIEVSRTKAALADDLAALEAFFRRHWRSIENNSPIKEKTLDRAHELFGLINQVIARPPAPKYPRSVAELADERLRAAVVMTREYDRLRGAVTYVRAGKGDADDLAPSLYRVHTAKRQRRARTAHDPSPEKRAAAGTDPVPASGAIPRAQGHESDRAESVGASAASPAPSARHLDAALGGFDRGLAEVHVELALRAAHSAPCEGPTRG